MPSEINQDACNASATGARQHEDHDAEENEPEFSRRAQDLGNQDNDRRTQRSTGQASNTPDYDHDQDVDRSLKIEVVRVQITGMISIKAPGDATSYGGDEEALALVDGDCHAAGTRGFFILRHRNQRATKARMGDPVQHQEHGRGSNQADVVK